MPMQPNVIGYRTIIWRCPDCRTEERDVLSVTREMHNRPPKEEIIELHCEECDRKRIGLPPAGEMRPVNRVFGKAISPDGP